MKVIVEKPCCHRILSPLFSNIINDVSNWLFALPIIITRWKIVQMFVSIFNWPNHSSDNSNNMIGIFLHTLISNSKLFWIGGIVANAQERIQRRLEIIFIIFAVLSRACNIRQMNVRIAVIFEWSMTNEQYKNAMSTECSR